MCKIQIGAFKKKPNDKGQLSLYNELKLYPFSLKRLAMSQSVASPIWIFAPVIHN